MYSSGGFSTKGMTSSVTATISSPKVVLITFSRRIVFSSTHNLIGYLFASRLVDIVIARSDYAGKQSNPCARTNQCPELLKMLETGASQILQLGFGPIVTKNACLLIGKCRNVDFSRTSHAQFFNPCLKSCVFDPGSSGGICESADDSVHVLGKGRVRIRSFRKNI